MVNETQKTVTENIENTSDSIDDIHPQLNLSNISDNYKLHNDEYTADAECDGNDNAKYDEYLNEIDNTDNQNNEIKKSNCISDVNFIHSILTNRYNIEIQRMQSLKSQSIFILTALGFLITIVVGIIGADWFSFPNFFELPLYLLLILIILIVSALICVYTACESMLKINGVGIYRNKTYWDYPINNTLELWSHTTTKILVDKNLERIILTYTTYHNYKNNQKIQHSLNISLNLLFVTFIFSFGFIIGIIIYII